MNREILHKSHLKKTIKGKSWHGLVKFFLFWIAGILGLLVHLECHNLSEYAVLINLVMVGIWDVLVKLIKTAFNDEVARQ